jgi:UPF0042 nucleotide-binding protein
MHSIPTLIITGLSGSGKSTVMRALEDAGFHCIDNLPPVLMPRFLELCTASSAEITKIAMVMDVRERPFLKEYPEIFRELKAQGQDLTILFLESTDEVLVRRYNETRRQHPLAERGTVLEGIRKERELLSGLRTLADEIIDTSSLSIHQLRNLITQLFHPAGDARRMNIILTSFGYKYGVPADADLVFDVRFLPNPFFVSELRNLSGNERPVYDYVMNNEVARRFREKFFDLIAFLTPLYEQEGKSYLTICVGCTGGMHRAVSVINSLQSFLAGKEYQVRVIHRDLGKT